MPSEEVQDPLSFACDITDVGSPGKIRSEFYTKIGMVADFLEQDVVNGIQYSSGGFSKSPLNRFDFLAHRGSSRYPTPIPSATDFSSSAFPPRSLCNTTHLPVELRGGQKFILGSLQ